MPSGTSVRSDYSRHKPHRKQINKFDRIRPILEQGVKNLIVPVYYGNDFIPERSGCFHPVIVMLDLTVLTAEFLIGPTISDLIAALQTHGRFSYVFLILHDANLERFTY